MIPFDEFQRLAREAFEEIPPEFRERVEGPVVVRDAHAHKDIRGMLTLGECVHSPDFAGGGELQSTVILYYGSFEEIARRDAHFDVEREIVETVRHEVQHHVEDQVGAPKLRDLDWAEEQNELWRQGRDFAPNFWRGGEPFGDPDERLRAVGGDLFHEVELREDEWEEARRDGLVLTVRDEELVIEPGELEEDEEVFEWEELGRSEHGEPPGDLVVIVRKRKSLLGLFRGRR